MKVIFLDFDGVLNSEQFVRMLYRQNKRGGLCKEFCPIASSNLLHILTEVPDCKIVVSSSWRIGMSVEDLQTLLFENCDVPKERVIDKTAYLNDVPRGLEIQDWLDKHPEVTHFVIVDDDSDMEHLKEKLVQTSWRHGLMLEQADSVIKALEPTSLCMDCGTIIPWAGGGRCTPCVHAKLKEGGE